MPVFSHTSFLVNDDIYISYNLLCFWVSFEKTLIRDPSYVKYFCNRIDSLMVGLFLGLEGVLH